MHDGHNLMINRIPVVRNKMSVKVKVYLAEMFSFLFYCFKNKIQAVNFVKKELREQKRNGFSCFDTTRLAAGRHRLKRK